MRTLFAIAALLALRTPPAPPTGLFATSSSGQVVLDWNNNTEPDLAGYNVYRSTTHGTGYVKINGSTLVAVSAYTDSTVTNGTTYFYVVRAVNTGLEESGNSNETGATPAGGPALSSVTRKVKTTHPRTNGYAPPGSTVGIYVNGILDGTTVALADGTWTQVTISAYPESGVAYQVKAKVGASPFSNIINVTVDTTAPQPPTDVASLSFHNCVEVKWKPSVSTDVLGYNVYRKTGAGSYVLITTTGLVQDTKYLDNTALDGTSYSYKVTAVDDAVAE